MLFVSICGNVADADVSTPLAYTIAKDGMLIG